MIQKNNQLISPETETEAMKIARANQRRRQTKEQTKLIAQGIEKGISQYKKHQKIKNRAIDKQRKQVLKPPPALTILSSEVNNKTKFSLLPWVLLGMTWFGLVIYIATNELF